MRTVLKYVVARLWRSAYLAGCREGWEHGASAVLQRMVDDKRITEEQRIEYLKLWGV